MLFQQMDIHKIKKELATREAKGYDEEAAAEQAKQQEAI